MYIGTRFRRPRYFGDGSIESIFAVPTGPSITPPSFVIPLPPSSWGPAPAPAPAPAPEPAFAPTSAAMVEIPASAAPSATAAPVMLPATALATVQAAVQAAMTSPSLQTAASAMPLLRAPAAPEATTREDTSMKQELRRQQTGQKQALQQEAAQTGQGQAASKPSALELSISPWLATSTKSDVKSRVDALPLLAPQPSKVPVLLLGGLALVALALLR